MTYANTRTFKLISKSMHLLHQLRGEKADKSEKKRIAFRKIKAAVVEVRKQIHASFLSIIIFRLKFGSKNREKRSSFSSVRLNK